MDAPALTYAPAYALTYATVSTATCAGPGTTGVSGGATARSTSAFGTTYGSRNGRSK
jgi:hypothetical protein